MLSAVSVLVIAQSSSEIPEGLMNNHVNSVCCLFKIILYYELFQINLPHLYKMTPSKLRVANTLGDLRPFYVSSRVTPILRRVRFRQVTKQIHIKYFYF